MSTHNVCFLRNKKDINIFFLSEKDPLFSVGKAPYLELCFPYLTGRMPAVKVYSIKSTMLFAWSSVRANPRQIIFILFHRHCGVLIRIALVKEL